MRRIKIAFFIILITVSLAFFSHFAVTCITQEVCAQLDAIQTSAQQGEYATALLQADALSAYFSYHQHLLEFFIKRDTVAAIGINLRGLPAYINQETQQDLSTEIEKTKEQMQMLHHLFVDVV